MTCDRVYRWRLLLEEYGPEIFYIKGVDNIAADAISRLEYDPKINIKNVDSHRSCYVLVKLFNHYCETTDRKYPGGAFTSKQTNTHNICRDVLLEPESTNDSLIDVSKDVFATISEEEDDIYPPTVAKIASEQRKNRAYRKYFKDKPFKGRDKKISLKVIDDEDILVYENNRWSYRAAKCRTGL